MDYASRLDDEETTRNYINQRASSSYGTSSYTSSFSDPFKHVQTKIPSSRRLLGDFDYRVDTRDLYSYKHYRKSNATLHDRNSRAKSPIMGRELDRYYKTEKRSDYLGDISSGGVRDFRVRIRKA